jgi:hypothetical protein
VTRLAFCGRHVRLHNCYLRSAHCLPPETAKQWRMHKQSFANGGSHVESCSGCYNLPSQCHRINARTKKKSCARIAGLVSRILRVRELGFFTAGIDKSFFSAELREDVRVFEAFALYSFGFPHSAPSSGISVTGSAARKKFVITILMMALLC